MCGGGGVGFINYIEKFSRYVYVYLLNSQDETIESYRKYKIEVENRLDNMIVIIRNCIFGEYKYSYAEI